MMDVSWTPPHQAFKRPSTAADTLTRLASFIARAESKTTLSRTHRPPQPPESAPGLPYTCSECGITFTYATELLTHQDSQHALPKPHRCPHCLQEFSLKSSLHIHNCEGSSQLYRGQASNSPTYATSLSNISENPIEDLADAQPHVVDTNPYACAPCGKTFTQKQALSHHQQDRCDTTPPPQCLDNLVSPALGSPLLSEEDSSSSNSLYAPDGESVCKFCSRTFQNEAAFQRHTKFKKCDKKESCESSNGDAKDAKPGKLSKGVFSCRSCDMVFNCTAKLYMHRKEKHSRGVKCFIEPTPEIKRHRRPSNSTYTCQICSKVFFHHLSLWAHTRKHPTSAPSNSKNVSNPAKKTTEVCTLLENVDSDKKVAPLKLTIRKNVWTKEAPTQQHENDKLKTTFKLLKHQKVPEEEDDNEEEDDEFPCPSCPEVFSQLSDLKTHAELHQTALNRGNCSVCACEMDSSKHAGAKKIRPYHCALCRRGFLALELFLSHCQDHLKARVEEERLNGATTDT